MTRLHRLGTAVYFPSFRFLICKWSQWYLVGVVVPCRCTIQCQELTLGGVFCAASAQMSHEVDVGSASLRLISSLPRVSAMDWLVAPQRPAQRDSMEGREGEHESEVLMGHPG